MTQRFRVLAVCLGLLYSCSLFSQVGFSLPVLSNTSTGQILDMPVSVVNFDSVFSVQFVIQWNPDILEFQSIEHTVNPLNIVDSVCFNLLETGSGFVRFRWYANSYKSLPNTAAIFSLKMKVTGVDGDISPVKFTELPPVTYFEVVRGVNNQFFFLNTALLVNGKVTVGIVGSNEPGSSDAGSLKVFPNPVASTATLSFELPQSSDVILRICDGSGRVVSQNNLQAQQGKNIQTINAANLPGAGIYYCQVVSAWFTQTVPFIVIAQ